MPNPYLTIIDDNIPDVDKKETQKRCPAIILVDCSGSMQESRDILHDSVRALYKQIMQDPCSSRAVELGIMSFNDRVTIHRNIKEIYLQTDMGNDIEFECQGSTLTGIAVQEALRRIEKRKASYVGRGIRSYAPILIIISDGAPFSADADDRSAELEAREIVCRQIRNEVAKSHLIVLSVEVGKRCDHDIMQELTGTDNPERVISHTPGKSISREISEAFSCIAKLLISQSNDKSCFNNDNNKSNSGSNKNNNKSNSKSNKNNGGSNKNNSNKNNRNRNNNNRNNNRNSPAISEEEKKAREAEIRKLMEQLIK